MSLACRILSMKHINVLGCAALLAASLATAQTPANQSSSPAPSSGWSSSQAGQLQIAEGAAPEMPAAVPATPGAPASSAALPAAPAPAAQDNNGNYSGWHGHDIVHRLTIEAGAGANAPSGDKQYITWGGQFLLGAGVNLNRHLAAMIEYQFLDDKIPGAIIAEAGAEGGHDHIWSLTIDPEFDLFPKSSNDVYLVGGGGFYRKVTDFTDVEPTEFCEFYYCGEAYVSQTVGHFSSNQGGFNIGGGYQHRFGGMYGMSRTRFFAEVRYLDVLSPAVTTQPNGLGTTSVGAGTTVIPITLGIRW